MSVIEYHNLKYKVSEGIDWITERRRLLYICKTFLPDGCENNIQDVLSLLDKLEEENHLAIDSLEVLKDLLKQMGEWSLLQMVEKFENKRKEYKRFLEQCGRVLDECSQLKRLISVCEGKISRDRQGHIRDVWTLFTELQKQNNLGIKRLEILKTMAIEMEKPDLLEQVEEFEKKTKQEEDAEREQNELEEARRKSQVVTPHCTFRNVAGGIVVVTTWMILRRSSSLEEFVNSFTEAVLPAANTLRAISEGSLCFTVQAETTSALEALWKRYQDGTLQRNLQEFLITEEIKQLVDSEVMLTVEIDEQEYSTAVWDLTTTETQETVVEKENKGLKDQTSSDSGVARVREAHPESREESNLRDRITFVGEYLANLQETHSMTTETTDSGLWSEESAPSESGFNKDTGDIQEKLEQLGRWMREITDKLNLLTSPRGKAARDEGSGLRKVTIAKKPVPATKTTTLRRRERVRDEAPVNIVEPNYQKQKEGSRVKFKCQFGGSNEVSYQWFKDGEEMQGQYSSTIVLDCVELRDFGCYECQVSFANGDYIASFSGELDVFPRDGMEYKRLSELDLNTKDKAGELLFEKTKFFHLGWKLLAFTYGMQSRDIEQLERKSEKPGRNIMLYLHNVYPNLTVYDFCKTLRGMRRFDIIKELLDHLSVPAPEHTVI